MMTEQKEIQLSKQIRLLSRQYCDGEFNKGEYRRRRRGVLEQCIDEQPPKQPETEVDEGPSALFKQNQSLDRMTYIMIAVTLGVVVVMGYLVHSLV